MCSEPMTINMKSLSEGDLGSITKKMISRVLDDKEQLEKLHRAIYEELCFEAMEKLSITEIENVPSQITSEANLNSVIEENKDAPNERLEQREMIDTKNELENPELMKKAVKSLIDARQRNDQAYNTWKREKARAMRRAWKEERERRQRELIAKQNEIERKRACREVYIREKRMQVSKRKMEQTRRKTKKDECLRLLEQESAKLAANEEAFRAKMKLKHSQMRQRCQPRRRVCILKSNDEFKFDAWLCQLNLIMSEKYGRDCRQRPRSSYCRSITYGASTLSTD